ncbi:MAG: ferredoxin:protochlorophyllide reductase (ATP-dependent) subunit B [Burkholderiaceae bacterium]
MQLSVWTYEGPPHVGAMRIAASMRGVHLVLHAPQGDTYADLLFTMIERQDKRPPVTYTTFQARDLGGDTANLVTRAVLESYERFKPQVLLVGESCTAELIQDQAGTLGQSLGLPIPVVPLELPAYSKKENWGASETLYQLTRALLASRAGGQREGDRPARKPGPPRANILGPTTLGFRCRDDVSEVKGLLAQLGIDVNAVVPLDASPDDIERLPDADFNIDLYPEISRTSALWLQRSFGMPFTRTIPMGLNATRAFIAEVAELAGVDPSPVLAGEQPGIARLSASQSRMQWYARSVDSTYLTGKRVFVFGDATHAIAAARIAKEEMGFTVVGLGTYSREFGREVREAARLYEVEALITDDYLEIESAIREAAPELVLGTQMERHIAKRAGIACAVISTPIHVQDVPARYSPVYGFEGANVIFDSWVHPLVMGLEEHLLQMFSEDFEFHSDATASHLQTAGHGALRNAADPTVEPRANETSEAAVEALPAWTADGERELRKIPFFVRSKARRNTERYARERGVRMITIETLYEAKAHFGR